MEINTCEKYVLAELETYKRRNAELEEKIEELKSLAQECKMADNETLNNIINECDSYKSLLKKLLNNIPLALLEKDEICFLNIAVMFNEADKNILRDIKDENK